MRSTIGLLIVLFTTLAFGLKPAEVMDKTPATIIGAWTVSEYSEDGVSYTKLNTNKLHNGPAIEFKESGVLVVIQNSGWCGTPPISYGSYEGTWLVNSAGQYELSYPYWGGVITNLWELKELTKKQMTVQVLDSQTIQDERF